MTAECQRPREMSPSPSPNPSPNPEGTDTLCPALTWDRKIVALVSSETKAKHEQPGNWIRQALRMTAFELAAWSLPTPS